MGWFETISRVTRTPASARLVSASAWASLVAGVAAAAWLAREVASQSFFVNDDYEAFLIYLTDGSIWDFLFAPMDVHIVPFHRALSALVFEMVGLDFSGFVAVLLAIHAVGVVYAFLTLRLLLPASFAGMFAAAYASSVFVVAPFGYWSSGAQRLPLAIAVFGASFHYLRWTRDPSRRWDAAVTGALFVLGLGFYSKAVLIPLYLGVLSLSLGGEPRIRRRTLKLLAALAVAGSTYVVAYRWHLPTGALDLSAGRMLLPMFVTQGAEQLVRGIGFDTSELLPAARLSTLLGIGALAVATTVLAPRNVLTWGGITVVWLVNWSLLALSPRGQMFGIFCLVALRYQFELLGVLVLFLAAVLANILRAHPQWLVPIRSPVGVGLLLCLSLGYSGVSIVAGTGLATSSRYDDFRRARDYMLRLKTSVRSTCRDEEVGTQKRPLRIARGWPPPYILGKHQRRFGQWPQFMKVLGVRAIYTRSPQYEVDATGELVRRQRR